MTIQPGTDIGRYHILEPLGEGGMARVYKALDTKLNVKVAVKFIRVDDLPLEQIERTAARFRVEAKKMAQLSHTNIVPVSDFGEYEHIPYLVMPLLHGGSLKKYIGAQMKWRTAAGLIAPLAEALAYTHKKGIIHRDVKPANILLSESDDPMLTDFGIAKIVDAAEAHQLTLTGSIIGTPEYMAPEQFTSTIFDERVDIYALGIVLYELITGRKPFIADTPSAVMIMQSRDPLPRPKTFVPDLPDEVERLLMKALAKDPQDRYKDMGTMAVELRRLAGMRTAAEQRAFEYERMQRDLAARKRVEEQKRKKEEDASKAAQFAVKDREKKEKALQKAQSSASKYKTAVKKKEKKPMPRIDKKRAYLIGGVLMLVLGWVGIALLGIQIQDVLKAIQPAGEEESQNVEVVPEATVSVTPTINPTPIESIFPTETAYLPSITGLTGEELIWEGVDQIGDNNNGIFDIVSARAVFSPPDDFTVEIFFANLPETLELGTGDNTGESMIENNWSVILDTDNDPTTGYDEIDFNTNKKISGIDYEFWLANFTSNQQTINLNTFSGWDIHNVMVPMSSGSLTVSQNIEYVFNPDENKLTMKGSISNIVPDAHVFVSTYQDESYGIDYLELELIATNPNTQAQQPIPTSAAEAATSNLEKSWFWQDEIDNSIEPILDIISGESKLSGQKLEITMNVRDIPQEITLSKLSIPNDAMDFSWFAEIDLDGDNANDLDFGLYHFKFPGEKETTISLEEPIDWGQMNYFIYLGNGEVDVEFSDINIYLNNDNNTVNIVATHPEFHSGMKIKLHTIGFLQEDQTNSVGESNQIAGVSEEGCMNAATFISETTPDGTIFSPGETFTKTWTLRNTGTCTWDENYYFSHSGRERLGGPVIYYIERKVQPEENYRIIFNLTAPDDLGKHMGVWDFMSNSNERLATYFVSIEVQ